MTKKFFKFIARTAKEKVKGIIPLWGCKGQRPCVIVDSYKKALLSSASFARQSLTAKDGKKEKKYAV